MARDRFQRANDAIAPRGAGTAAAVGKAGPWKAMTTEALRRMPARVGLHMATLTLLACDAVLPLLRKDRIAAAATRLWWRIRRAVRRADEAFAAFADRTTEYLAAADVPAEKQRRLERFLREIFFVEPAPRALVENGRFHRVRHLATDVAVALTGTLVAAAGFVVAVREPLVYGRAVLVPFVAAVPPFLALGISALRSLSLELSERRSTPRRPRLSRSAMKKRLRSLRPHVRKSAA